MIRGIFLRFFRRFQTRRWTEKVNEETIFSGLKQTFFLGNFIMQTCVWMERNNNSIFDLFSDHQILFSESEVSRVLVTIEAFLPVCRLLTINLFLFIKRPMPVIESPGDDETPKSLPSRKVNAQNKGKHDTMLETSLKFLLMMSRK